MIFPLGNFPAGIKPNFCFALKQYREYRIYETHVGENYLFSAGPHCWHLSTLTSIYKPTKSFSIITKYTNDGFFMITA